MCCSIHQWIMLQIDWCLNHICVCCHDLGGNCSSHSETIASCILNIKKCWINQECITSRIHIFAHVECYWPVQCGPNLTFTEVIFNLCELKIIKYLILGNDMIKGYGDYKWVYRLRIFFTEKCLLMLMDLQELPSYFVYFSHDIIWYFHFLHLCRDAG